MALCQASYAAGTKEFNIDIEQQQSFLIEINKKDDSDIFLFCKPVNDGAKYFFMGKDEACHWEIISKFTVPSNILALEEILSEKVAEAMTARISR